MQIQDVLTTYIPVALRVPSLAQLQFRIKQTLYNNNNVIPNLACRYFKF